VSARYLNQDEVAEAAVALAREAKETLDVASPWIEPLPVQKLVGELLPRTRTGEVKVRLVYRLSEESDLRITDLAVLEMLAAEGVQVRFSRRLHAKLIVGDRTRAIIGSANLTRRGGYGYGSQPGWRNEEGAIAVEGDPAAEAAAHFDTIWEAAEELAPDLLGVVMDFPSVREFRFVAVADVAAGQMVAAGENGRAVVGEIVELTTYNQSFPQMTEEIFLTQGYGGFGQRRVHLPDLPTLFSHPVKDQGFLVAKTFFHPESAFQIARVRVLRQLRAGEPVSAVQPISPGANVTAPAPALLRLLLGDGDLRLGRMQHHANVGVWVRSDELLTTHLAVLGMTGSGKSNGLKHLLRELRPSQRDLRAFVVDTHGEYTACAVEIDGATTLLDVSIPDKVNLLDWEMVREHFSVERMTAKIKKGLRDAGKEEDAAAAAARLSHDAARNETLEEIAEALEADPDAFCFGAEDPRIINAGTDDDASLVDPGLYVLELRETGTFAVRSKKCAVLAERVFTDAKASNGERPALLVVDEAHNYIPERTTGFMAEAVRHGSLGALTTIAVEGRKFRLGLVVSSQRPSRIAKDVLAQMNSQLIFRLANVEDLGYVRESFEAAGAAFLADLPTLDTGICLCAGTMIAMPVRCDMPLFAPRRRFPLAAATLPRDREALKDAIVAVMPEVALVAEAEEFVVFAGRDAEVTIRSQDGAYVLDVDCADEAIAEWVREALHVALGDGSAS
jgi:hypothetical protein